MDDTWGIDSHKLIFHPDRVAQWLAADTWDKAKSVYPIYFEVTPCGACNHRCKFCSVDTIGYKPILMNADLIIDRMAESKALGVKSVMFAGTGEPLVHKEIDRINEGAINAGIDTAFTTNGVLLERLESIARTSWVKVSLNAGSRDGYAAMHRTKPEDWDKVWRNIYEASKRKGKCTLGIQCVVLPDTVFEMRSLAQEASNAGADYLVLKPYSQGTFQTSHEYEGTTYEKWEGYLAGLQEFSTATFKVIVRMNAMREESGTHTYEKCKATPVFWVYAMANGDVFTCSDHLTEARFCIGNLYKQTFKEVWEGERRRENWEMMKTFDIKECRLNCRMNQQNKYLDSFSTISHVNFI